MSKTKTPSGKVATILDKAPSNYSLSNKATRKWYATQDKKILRMVDKTASVKMQAQQAHRMRNIFRSKARALMSDRGAASGLNRSYPNKTWNEVYIKYNGNYKKILDGAQRSNVGVNQKFGVK